MIIIDWGNLEETLIVMRVVDKWSYQQFQSALQKIHQMLALKLLDVDLMIDIRLADNLPASTFHSLNQEIEHRLPSLRHIIAISTSVQERTIHLAANFYPKIVSEILITRSVDKAYQYVSA